MSRNHAPKDFWPQIHELNTQLHAAAPINKSRMPGVQTSELSWLDSRDEASITDSEYKPNMIWKGTQILGGLAYYQGMLKVIQPIEATGAGKMVMGMGRLLTYRHAYDTLGDYVTVHSFNPLASPPEMKFIEEMKHIEWVNKQGLVAPTSEDYNFLLGAMTFGTTGHGRLTD